MNLVQSVLLLHSDSETSSDEEKIEQKIEDKTRLLDYLWLELAASNAVDAAVERTLQLEITRLQRNIDYTAKEHTQGRGSFYRPV